MGERSAFTWTRMSPAVVVIVTVRVWPAGSAAGWLVGQPTPWAATDVPGDAAGVAPPLPSTKTAAATTMPTSTSPAMSGVDHGDLAGGGWRCPPASGGAGAP